ncbi:hypothetical protein EG68_06161 [Paragonimus skrjabini miyazakii]|uniref:Uncharacterized protein n=1 Tax=Paragonimus skrjabini miyazakii TaxID=59628 RepID=A0A8S9YPK5_9TREM|nr:hypothetical protein EG68_06161 [Paragonimus skrjabini miyazakii]
MMRQMALHPQKAHGWNKLRKEESPLLRDSNLSFYGSDHIRQTPPGTVRLPTRMSWMTGETGEMILLIDSSNSLLRYRSLELLKKNWETDEPHLGELEHRMRQWYNTVEMANNWHFVVPNTISTLKRFKQEDHESVLQLL